MLSLITVAVLVVAPLPADTRVTRCHAARDGIATARITFTNRRPYSVTYSATLTFAEKRGSVVESVAARTVVPSGQVRAVTVTASAVYTRPVACSLSAVRRTRPTPDSTGGRKPWTPPLYERA